MSRRHTVIGAPELCLLASYSSDGFALASDGKVQHPDGTQSEAKKIFRVGNLGAAGMEGSVRVQELTGSKITAAVDVPTILEHWLSDHPNANIETANHEVVAMLVSEFKKFFDTRNPGADAGSFRFRLVFWGFVDHKPLWLFNKFYVPTQSGEAPRVDTARTTPKAGNIWAWGAWLIQEELMGGTSPQLQSYKENPSIKLIRQSAKETISKEQFLKVL